VWPHIAPKPSTVDSINVEIVFSYSIMHFSLVDDVFFHLNTNTVTKVPLQLHLITTMIKNM